MKVFAICGAIALCAIVWLSTHPSDSSLRHLSQHEASALCEMQGHGVALSEETRAEGVEDTHSVYHYYPCQNGSEVAAYQS